MRSHKTNKTTKQTNKINLGEQRARLAQHLDDRAVAVAEHAHPVKLVPRLGGELARVVHGGEERQVVLETCLVIFLAVTRRRVHEPRTRVGRDVVAADDDFARAVEERVRVLGAGELTPLEARHLFEGRLRLQLHLGEEVLTERLCDEYLVLELWVREERIVQIFIHSDCKVRGDRPWRGRPNRDAHLEE